MLPSRTPSAFGFAAFGALAACLALGAFLAAVAFLVALGLADVRTRTPVSMFMRRRKVAAVVNRPDWYSLTGYPSAQSTPNTYMCTPAVVPQSRPYSPGARGSTTIILATGPINSIVIGNGSTAGTSLGTLVVVRAPF